MECLCTDFVPEARVRPWRRTWRGGNSDFLSMDELRDAAELRPYGRGQTDGEGSEVVERDLQRAPGVVGGHRYRATLVCQGGPATEEGKRLRVQSLTTHTAAPANRHPRSSTGWAPLPRHPRL